MTENSELQLDGSSATPNGNTEVSSELAILRPLSGLVVRRVEPVGRWFHAYALRRAQHRSLSHVSHHSGASESGEEDEEGSGADENEFVDDEPYLKKLDPKEWKDQDHYRVLGLRHLRFKATEKDIKKAYKMMVLKHHPDKRQGKQGGKRAPGDDDYFTCITRAFETLGNPIKRRSYDSVDPEFDDNVPNKVDEENRSKFYRVFGPVFELNSRWSSSKRVPQLGDEKATFEEVDEFYTFWYDFDSWREFSYLDEDDKEKGECREERRWIEKQNKVERQRRKKEETARLRKLVDNAYSSDPRIARFKEEEKQKRNAEKRAKQEAIRQRAEDEKRKEEALKEAERLEKEKIEEEQRQRREKEKKEKMAEKKKLQKERKTLRSTAKEKNYFVDNGNSTEDEKVKNMAEVEKLCELLEVTTLQELNSQLAEGNTDAFHDNVRALNKRLEDEKAAQVLATAARSQGGAAGGHRAAGRAGKMWPADDLAILVKAVNLFPGGTNNRWEVVANFFNQHSSTGVERTAKDCIGQTKLIQNMDEGMKKEVNHKAFQKFEELKKKDARITAETSQAQDRELVGEKKADSSSQPWTGEEQKLLEQALKTYPATDPSRWDNIAKTLPGRTKKDCMKRYKELVELVKAKKLAQQAAKRQT